MWKNSLKNVESDNNKILYETLLDFFLQRNGTYFLNKPRTSQSCTQVRFWRKTLRPSSLRPDNGGRWHLRNVDISLSNYKSSHHRRHSVWTRHCFRNKDDHQSCQFLHQPVQPNTPSSALMSTKSKVGNLRQAAGDNLFKSQISYFWKSLYCVLHVPHQRDEFREFKAVNLCILMYLSTFLCVSSAK